MACHPQDLEAPEWILEKGEITKEQILLVLTLQKNDYPRAFFSLWHFCSALCIVSWLPASPGIRVSGGMPFTASCDEKTGTSLLRMALESASQAGSMRSIYSALVLKLRGKGSSVHAPSVTSPDALMFPHICFAPMSLDRSESKCVFSEFGWEDAGF